MTSFTDFLPALLVLAALLDLTLLAAQAALEKSNLARLLAHKNEKEAPFQRAVDILHNHVHADASLSLALLLLRFLIAGVVMAIFLPQGWSVPGVLSEDELGDGEVRVVGRFRDGGERAEAVDGAQDEALGLGEGVDGDGSDDRRHLVHGPDPLPESLPLVEAAEPLHHDPRDVDGDGDHRRQPGLFQMCFGHSRWRLAG